MAGSSKRRVGFLAAFLVCLVISVVAFSGLILRSDVVGRIVFGVVWAALGVVWLGSYFGAFFGQSKSLPRDDGPAL